MLFVFLSDFCLTVVLSFLSCVLCICNDIAPKVINSPTLPPYPQTCQPLSSVSSPPYPSKISLLSSPSSVFTFPSPPTTPPVYLLPVAPVLPHFSTLPYSPPLLPTPRSPFSCSAFFFPPNFSPSAVTLPSASISSSLQPHILSPTLKSQFPPSNSRSSPTLSSLPAFVPASPPSPSPALLFVSSPPPQLCNIMYQSSSPIFCPPSPPPSPLPPGIPSYFRRDRSVPEIYI